MHVSAMGIVTRQPPKPIPTTKAQLWKCIQPEPTEARMVDISIKCVYKPESDAVPSIPYHQRPSFHSHPPTDNSLSLLIDRNQIYGAFMYSAAAAAMES